MQQYQSQLALFGAIIDYAGTFPPAALPLDGALHKAATFRRTARFPWLMSKIALPLADIKKLTTEMLLKAQADGTPWLFTALGSPITDSNASEILRVIEWDLREIAHLNEKRTYAPLRQSIVAYETKLPVDPTQAGIDGFFPAVENALGKITTLLKDRVDPFFEVSPDANWLGKVLSLIEAMADWAEENQETGIIPGIKVRTGGAVIPTTEELSQILARSVQCGIRFKATQGLHDAITHDGKLGFVNLFSALTLAAALGSDEFGKDQIKHCLECENVKEFQFSTSGFQWKKYQVSLDAIEPARRRHAATFGSCSLEEPDESLALLFQ